MFWKLDGKTPVPCTTEEWGRWFSTADRRVAVTRVREDVEVSTVFVGLAMGMIFDREPPDLFETMIFGGPHAGYQERYPTWGLAERGHARAVARAMMRLVRGGS